MIDTRILSGTEVASSVYSQLKSRIERLFDANITPGLAAIIVGDNPASQLYVRNKTKRFKKLGLVSEIFNLPSSSSKNDILEKIIVLNNDDRFHGILLQLPTPKGLNTKTLLKFIDPHKDIDGFHPENVGLLSSGDPRFIPCTPKGIIRMLNHFKVQTNGKHAVVIGRSHIVGKPIAFLLSGQSSPGNATVTICHSRTKDLKLYTRQADIIIASAGVANLINGNIIKKGSIIIDVGINRINDNSDKGFSLVGDVDFSSVLGIAQGVTPVPGGVGPMTIAMLVENTIESAERYYLAKIQ